jgi:hypothetical protein
MKPSSEGSSDVAEAEQDKAQGEKMETRTKVGASSKQLPNWTVWFPKMNHLVSPGSEQKRTSRTTAPGMALTPHWCPSGLTPSQRRRI